MPRSDGAAQARSRPPRSCPVLCAPAAAWGQRVSGGDIDRLPTVLARPRAVLYDTAAEPSLLYVFGGGARRGKFVVRVRRASDRAGETNRVTTAGYVDSASVRGSQYRLLDGSLDDE